MTRDLRRLQGIESLFSSREQAAARELAQFEKLLNEAQGQLNVLRDYRNNNLANDAPSGNPNRAVIENRATFLRRLDDAIARQQQVVRRATADRDHLRQRFDLCRRRTLAVGKVHGKRLAEHRSAVERQEQKETDAWRRPAADTKR